MSNCSVCGEPMPEGETMFKFHGYSGLCPKPPLTGAKRPVAFRVIAGDGKVVLFDDEGVASRYAESLNLDYQGLYVRDGS